MATTKALKSAQREIQELEEALQGKNNYIKRLENPQLKNPITDHRVVEEQREAITSLQRVLAVKNKEVKELESKLNK